ncbi:hypothetical protein N752_19270 [Desulforamulus aquiferis]|nr:GNAT family N-acetyltransferase [Desulforamulus aquiferis]RYD03549.1 hypothetical protein N752_19270 [Desulforamulus aquiferis]
MIEAWYDASIIAHNFIPEEFWASEKDNIKQNYLPVVETYVAEIEGKVVGFISLIENFIGGLFIAPLYQGKGIGSELIKKACSVKEKELVVEVYKENLKAQEFYKKCGFEIFGERVQAETGCLLIEMRMTIQ